MEYCMEARALKPRFFREQTVVRPNSSHTQPQPFTADDFLLMNAPGGVVSSDVDFSVDCFFDFSSGEFKDHIIQEKNKEEEDEEEEKDSVSISNSSSFSANSLLTSQLALPDDELAELEWVSRFVDDSPLEFSLLHPLTEAKTESHRFKPECKPAGLKITPCFFPTRVPAKPRTKRPRPTGQTWSVGSPLTDSSSQSPSSSTTSVTSTPCLVFNNAVPTDVSSQGSTEPPVKKPKKRQTVQTGGELLGSIQFQRRCTHCQVQKTPQWRTGPLGPKTLCNACGVRYKSGRLFPEYRPACSPTFSVEVHSNSHRKVLEMRKKREVGGLDQSSCSNQVGFLKG